MTDIQKQPQTYWGIFAILCVAGALTSWFLVDKKALNVAKKPVEDTVVEDIQVETITANKTLGFLTKEVPPLELKKRVVAINADHGLNFRGTKFMQENAKKWTVELFRANEEKVILDYMQHHRDEKELFYTRLSGDNQEEIYVVFYGRLKTKEVAQLLAEQLVTLDLPKTLTPTVTPFSAYVKLVNEVGADESMSGINRLYHIGLSPVQIPKPVAPSASTSSGVQPKYKPAPEPVTRVVRPQLPELNNPVEIPRE